MASIGRDKDGKKRVLFTAPDGKRKTIRLGKCTYSDAEAIKYRVENLLSAAIQGKEPCIDDAGWISRISPLLKSKLHKVGLINMSGSEDNITLGDWVDGYIKGRTDIKPRTTRNLEVAARSLFEFCSRAMLLVDFTDQDAADLRVHMLNRGLAEATVRRRCKRCKQFFTAARKKRLIVENPFDDVPTADRVNKERQKYISREKIERVIAACPDSRWRLIFALSRYAGLRIPSELIGLTWDDILWDQKRFIVRSPKTEHIEGKDQRTVPLFPELEQYLLEAMEQAEPGQKHVIEITQKGDCNFGTQAHRIIKRAGLLPWPKTFHNLRASLQTDLVEYFPVHVVADWLGNSPAIADKHYLQVTEEHYRRAISAAQNPAQLGPISTEKWSNAKKLILALETISPGICNTLQNFFKSCDFNSLHLLPPRGLEPLSPG